jgi:hypothetical protein
VRAGPFFEARTSGRKSRNRLSRLGESWRTLRSVGLMSRATGIRSWISGWVFVGELVEAVEREAGLALERREDLERLGQSALLACQRTEGVVGVRDHARQRLRDEGEPKARGAKSSSVRGIIAADEPNIARKRDAVGTDGGAARALCRREPPRRPAGGRREPARRASTRG